MDGTLRLCAFTDTPMDGYLYRIGFSLVDAHGRNVSAIAGGDLIGFSREADGRMRSLKRIIVPGAIGVMFGLTMATAQHRAQGPAREDARLHAVLDPLMEKAVADQNIPGGVLLVGHNGRVVYRKAFGWRSLEPEREPMTVDTIFDLASLTKCVATTTAVMQLFEEGRVRLNDPVAAYLPEFAQNGKQD